MTDLFVPAPQSSLWSFYIKYFQPCNAGWEEGENEEHVANSGHSWALWSKAVGKYSINPSLCCCFIYILARMHYLFIKCQMLWASTKIKVKLICLNVKLVPIVLWPGPGGQVVSPALIWSVYDVWSVLFPLRCSAFNLHICTKRACVFLRCCFFLPQVSFVEI